MVGSSAETAGRSVLRVVEPEPEVERVGGCQVHVLVDTEDLVEQDRANLHVARAVRAHVNVRLVPRKTELALEVRIGRFIRQERGALHRKEIEGESGFESIEIQNHSVIEFAANYRSPGPGLFIRGFAKAIDKLRICHQIKTDFVFLVGAEAASGETTAPVTVTKVKMIVPDSRFPALRELVVSHCIPHFV